MAQIQWGNFQADVKAPVLDPASPIVAGAIVAEESILLSANDDAKPVPFPVPKRIRVDKVPANTLYTLELIAEYRAYGIVAKDTATAGRDQGVAEIDFTPAGAQCAVSAYG